MNGIEFDKFEKIHLPELGEWIQVFVGLLISKNKADELDKKVLK